MSPLRGDGIGMKAVVVACLVAIAGVTFAAGPDPLSDISITPGQVTWSPKIEAEEWMLTVSGRGIHLKQVAAAGEPLRLQMVAPDGERLPDGNYNWELRPIGRGTSEGDEEEMPASIRQRAPRREGPFDQRAVQRPLVESGSFVVVNGGFVPWRPAADDEPRVSGAR